jgi:reprolysin-like metallo-peptidase family M12B
MSALLNRLFRNTRPEARRKPVSVRLELEALEDRRVMSTIITSDMTELAQHFGRHSGPTTLWLNFDGWTDQGVSSFQAVSGNRTQDIHDILFKTQQLFAPFDVIVRRRFGEGNRDTSSSGNTTVFIGDNTSYGTGTGMEGLDIHTDLDEVPGAASHDAVGNGAGAFTPWSSSDFPGDNKGLTHQPNSDPYDVAFVDPLYYSGGSNVSRSTLWISRAIAHEAGHTFGLVHVLSNPDQEIMSYDAANVRFVNKTFTITDLNYNPSTGSNYNEPWLQPKYKTYINFGWFQVPFVNTITTQNSFTYLQAALGPRSTIGDFANVADTTAVDSAYVDGTTWVMSVGSSVTAGVNRSGDFDVYSFTPASSQWVTIDAKRLGTSTVDPVLLVYGSSGQTVIGFDDDSGAGLESQLTLYVTAGTTYKLAVGSYAGSSTGNYELSISTYFVWPWWLLATLKTASSLDYAIADKSLLAATSLLESPTIGSASRTALQGSDQLFALYPHAADTEFSPDGSGRRLGPTLRSLAAGDLAALVGRARQPQRPWNALVNQLFETEVALT